MAPVTKNCQETTGVIDMDELFYVTFFFFLVKTDPTAMKQTILAAECSGH